MRVGLFGFGRWGKIWARVVSGEADLKWVVDPAWWPPLSPEKETEATVAAAVDLGCPFLRAPDWDAVDAVVIATPPTSHAQLAIQALRHGKHVLVEKPVALTVTEAKAIAAEAHGRGLVYSIDYTFLHTPEMVTLQEMSTELGAIEWAWLEWTNWGQFRQDVDAWWSAAPHPISVLWRLWSGAVAPREAAAWAHATDGERFSSIISIADCRPQDSPRSIRVGIRVCWETPDKVRKLTLAGPRGAILVDWVAHTVTLRKHGDREPVVIHHQDDWEALWACWMDFQNACTKGTQLVTDGLACGMWVTAALKRMCPDSRVMARYEEEDGRAIKGPSHLLGPRGNGRAR